MDRSSTLKSGVILLLLGGLVAWRMAEDRPFQTPATSQSTAPATASGTPSTKDSSAAYATGGRVKITDIKIGSGAVAKAGQHVTVHYRGTLTDGKQFDASYDRGEPFSFTLGAGEVIKGWDQGVAGMKVGGKRKLVIPPDLGYGLNGSPPTIPPSATLLFDVELLKVG